MPRNPLFNTNTEIFHWGPVEFRLLYGAWWQGIFVEVPKYYAWPWPPHALIFENGRMVYVTDKEKLYAAGEKYFRHYFLNVKNHHRHWQLWREWINRFNALQDEFKGQRLSKTSDGELLRLYKSLRDTIIDFWLIVHVPEIANWGGEVILERLLEKIDNEHAHEYLEILSAPVKPSFFQEEEIDLLRLAQSPKGRLPELLREHARSYRWLLNSYGGDRVLGAGYFHRKLKELTLDSTAAREMANIKKRLRASRRRKQALARKLGLNKKVIFAADQLSQSIWWQDHRKGYIWRYQDVLDRLIREVARRRKKKFAELLWCWPEEIERLIARRLVDFKKVNARGKAYVVRWSGGRTQEYYGDTARLFLAKYTSLPQSDAQEVRGLVVSRRKGFPHVRGVVKIIHNPFKDGKKMKVGDILVAGMTSPEFVILMRKAAAIVTDHGGLTSHAAVVSRELGIPCIVGTKVATKVFKDGDVVEVDATTGVVRRL